MSCIVDFISSFGARRSARTISRSSLLAAKIFIVSAACFFLASCGGSSSQTPFLNATVGPTQNPLVAQYSVNAGCIGPITVEFGPDTTYGRTTSQYTPAASYHPFTIPVAGMRPSTTYHMHLLQECNGQTVSTPDTTFTTGVAPLPFPALQVTRPNPSAESPGIELIDTIGAASGLEQAFFTDRDGTPIWYYDVGTDNYPFTFKTLLNGNLVFSIANATTGFTVLREIDLAGNTIREMDISGLQEKTAAAGYNFIPASFHHDLLPLDNGHLIVLVFANQAFTDLPGYPGQQIVQGDQLIDLDENWNPVWYWNSFDHLDVNRHLNGLPDWTHSNAIVYLPQDGSLLLSMRHQSWVLKIDYNNGAGTGNVLWKLGYQGDFAMAEGDDPSLWFSFQHYPSLISQDGSQTTLAIWDNGDNRVLDTSGTICGSSGQPACFSQASILQLDEGAMVATRLWNDVPGGFGFWGGSVSELSNGNVEFDLNAPVVPPSPNVASEVQEVTQTGTPSLVWKMDIPLPMNAYRAYRVPSLYPGVTWP